MEEFLDSHKFQTRGGNEGQGWFGGTLTSSLLQPSVMITTCLLLLEQNPGYLLADV